MERTVVGLFESPEEAKDAAERLGALGVPSERVGSAVAEGSEAVHRLESEARAAGRGALTGGMAGGVLGAATGGLAMVVVPGAGVIAAGALVAVLTGASAGATGGAVLGGLVGLGIADEEAAAIEGSLERGHILLSVHVPRAQVAPVRTALLAAGAHTVAVGALAS